MSKIMTREQVDSLIQEFDPAVEPGSREFQAYRAVFTATLVGGHSRKIEAFWRGDNCGMRRMLQNLRSNNVFNVCGSLDSEIYSDGVGFALGACIALGFIQRFPHKSIHVSG